MKKEYKISFTCNNCNQAVECDSSKAVEQTEEFEERRESEYQNQGGFLFGADYDREVRAVVREKKLFLPCPNCEELWCWKKISSETVGKKYGKWEKRWNPYL